MRKKIVILGSTGSIGESALRVIDDNPKNFEVLGLTAGKNLELLARQIKKYHPTYVSIQGEEDAEKLNKVLSKNSLLDLPKIYFGDSGAVEVAKLKGADMILSAIVGSAALKPTFAAIKEGKRVALANKESIVMAGRLIVEEAKRSNAQILPVDSEHSAIFQSMLGHNRGDIERLILTASGGPFYNRGKAYLKKVTLKEALNHPNWKMGAKITIDSATLMNKALEVIEARWLFDIKPERISVMIHPQSIIHSIVEYRDGSMIAQMGVPDMRVPISYALSYPERLPSNQALLNLEKIEKLTFYKPRADEFPTLKYAYMALDNEDSMSVVLNSANEASVNAFICGKIKFLEIPKIIGIVVKGHKPFRLHSIDEAISVHNDYTKLTNKMVERL